MIGAWQAFVGPDKSGVAWWQMCDRTVIVFFLGLVLIRISGRRTFSRESPLEVIVAIVIGSNLSRGLTGNAPFVGVLVSSALLVVIHRLLAHACRRSTLLASIFKGRPVRLVQDGQVDERAMDREAIGDEDLAEALRGKGCERIDEVRLAMLEFGGQISVLTKSP